MGIGVNNRVPWWLKGDLKYFSELTCGAAPGKINAVIMGRKTWESLPEAHRPLKRRLNVVLSRNGGGVDTAAVIWASSLEEAMQKLGERKDLDQVFVIGGANVFAQAIKHPDCSRIFLTEVLSAFECDTFFPKIPEKFKKISESAIMEENGLKYMFVVYEK